jgi:hypothetical protein
MGKCDICGVPNGGHVFTCQNAEKTNNDSNTQVFLEGYNSNKETVSNPASVACYDEIIGAIKNAPLTQLPAILMNTVEACIERNVFISGDRLVDVVGKIVKRLS